MRNLKKFLAVILAIAVMATTMVPAFAAEDYTYEYEADALYDLGLIAGDASGDLALGRDLTRKEGITIVLKLFGYDPADLTDEEIDEALAGFADAEAVKASWFKGWAAVGVDAGLIAGTVSGNINPDGPFSGKQMATLILKVLGYEPNYNVACAQLAKVNGLTPELVLLNDVNLTRDQAFGMMFAALKAEDVDGVTIADMLIAMDIISLDQAIAYGLVAIASVEEFKATVKVGQDYTLPEKVTVVYADGTEGTVAVTWEDDVVDTSKVGVVTVKGTIAGYDAEVTATITVEAAVFTFDSASASNLKEIVVTFSSAVDATTGETAANYTLSTGTVASAKVDGKTVKLTLTGSAAQQSSLDITVKNVTDTAGIKVADTTKSILMFDVTVPVAESYAFTGPQTIEVTYSEPIDPTQVGTALVDNGVYGSSVAAHATKNNVLVVSLGTVLPEGAHTLKMSGAKDYVPYTALDKVFDVTYTKDTAAPTVSLDSATQKKVVIKFSKEVKGNALLTTRFYHTYTAYTPDNVTDSAGNAINVNNYYDTVVVDFTSRPLPAGTANVVVLAKVGDISIADRYGNVLAADAILPATIIADTIAPTITKVEATSESTVVVTFSEDVTGAATKANYVFKKADGTVIGASAYGAPVYAGGTTFTATITFTPALAGGAYSVEVSNIKDSSLSANAMVMVPQPFMVSDKTPIASASAIAVETATAGNDFIYITYPENMTISGPNSILELGNYKIGTTAAAATALPSGSTITIFGTNDKVKLSIPGTGAADLTGKRIYVRNLADASGNVMTALYIEIVPSADAAPSVTAIKSIALNTFEITVDKQLSAINAADILKGGVPVSYATYKNNSNGTATITVIVPDGQKLANEGVLPAGFSIGAGGYIKSITGSAMTSGAIGVTGIDGLAPKFVGFHQVNGNTIIAEYSEGIDETYLSLATYTVADNTVTAIDTCNSLTDLTAAVNSKYVKITTGTTLPATNTAAVASLVTQVGPVRDTAVTPNVLAAFDGKAAADKWAPVVTTKIAAAATLTANATHTLVFSEALDDASKTAVEAAVVAAYAKTGTAAVSSAWNTEGTTLTVTITADATNTVTLSAIADIAVTDVAENTSAALDVQE